MKGRRIAEACHSYSGGKADWANTKNGEEDRMMTNGAEDRMASSAGTCGERHTMDRNVRCSTIAYWRLCITIETPGLGRNIRKA